MLMFQAVNLKRAEAAGSDHTLDLFVGILRNERHLPAFPKERYSAFIRSLGQGALSYVDAPVWQGFLGDENVPSSQSDANRSRAEIPCIFGKCREILRKCSEAPIVTKPKAAISQWLVWPLPT